VYASIADPDKPDLSVRVAGKKTIRSRERVFGYLERACFDINGDNLALIAFLDLGTDLSLVNLIPTSSELFFAVPRLTYTHGFAPMASQRLRQYFHQVLRAFAGEVLDLLATGDAGGDDVEVAVGGPHLRLNRREEAARTDGP
jgi:hypothetical protein